MQIIKLRGQVGEDGILKLKVQTGRRNQDLEVVLVLQDFPASAFLTPYTENRVTPLNGSTPEELGWPPGFFEQTAGSLKDEPIELEDETKYKDELEVS